MVRPSNVDALVIPVTWLNYTENGDWDTSKALVRRTLERCIQVGRQARAGGNKVDTYESYRLLGQAVGIH